MKYPKRRLNASTAHGYRPGVDENPAAMNPLTDEIVVQGAEVLYSSKDGALPADTLPLFEIFRVDAEVLVLCELINQMRDRCNDSPPRRRADVGQFLPAGDEVPTGLG